MIEDLSSEIPAHTVATYPFDDTCADVILRTSDNIDFYVYKIVLALASPFFKDMFSLIQPTSTNESHHIVPFTESGSTIEHILQLVYPISEPPPPTTLNMVDNVLEASIKYQIEKTTAKMKQALLTFVDSEPVAVFAIACRLMLEDEAMVAARACWRAAGMMGSNHPGHVFSSAQSSGFPQEMERISAGPYFRLLRYVKNRDESAPFHLQPPPASGIPAEDGGTPPSSWRGTGADVILESRDGIQLPAHMNILSLVSAGEMLGKGDNRVSAEGGLPIIRLDEEFTAIRTLLRLCYPFPEDGGLIDLQHLARIMATKYNIPKAASLAQDLMGRQMEENPLRVYLIAKEYGWETEVKTATRECTNMVDSERFYGMYAPEMETCSARVYYDLLECCLRERVTLIRRKRYEKLRHAIS
ncbi:hypothetical protein NLI96_g8648 [Meripilus lineatus]|uniref:BTB domain-containing protein n=1 Tax=Meripilus lineatus TaxID=2056292 RepID=A0AAD5YBT6_9APHY|nr:hypothetical protein NLI96_g8648 [Physisporinus lineatus]